MVVWSILCVGVQSVFATKMNRPFKRVFVPVAVVSVYTSSCGVNVLVHGS